MDCQKCSHNVYKTICQLCAENEFGVSEDLKSLKIIKNVVGGMTVERLSDRAIEIINELHTERLDYNSEYLPLIDAANKLNEMENILGGYDFDELRKMVEIYRSTQWVSVQGGNLPPNKGESWKKYIVAITRGHSPTLPYDMCDSPYDEDFVATALYDSEQKIWHIDNWDEQLNALIDLDDAPMNGDFVTHWMEMPIHPSYQGTENEKNR